MSQDASGFPRFAKAVSGATFIVTAAAGGVRDGCLVGFGTQVSIHPPRMLVCVSDKNATHRTALRATHLGVHLIPDDRLDLAELFGGKTGDDVDKFSRCRWEQGPGGVPLLPDCPDRFAGRVLERHPFGDHTAFLLDPVAVWAAREAEPLDIRDAGHIDPGHQP